MIGFPKLDAETPADILNSIRTRETPFSEYSGAKFETGLDQTFIKQGLDQRAIAEKEYGNDPIAFLPEVQGMGYTPTPNDTPEAQPMAKEEWEASEWHRDKIPWQDGMTVARAQAYAEAYDKRRYRESLIERSPTGLRSIWGFGAQLLGTAVDPVNYIPFLGAANEARMVARFGQVAGRSLTSATEAVIGTALTDPLVFSSLNKQGEDLGWEDGAIDVMFGAAVGGLLGAGSGFLHQRKVEELRRRISMPDREVLGRAIEKALDDISNGNPVDVKAILELRSEALKAQFRHSEKVRQPDLESLDDLYTHAEAAHQEHVNLTEELASRFNGQAHFRPEEIGKFKSQESAARKLKDEILPEGGDVNDISDLLASTVTFGNMADVTRALVSLANDPRVVKIKDRFSNPSPDGYRDVLLKVQMSNGHIAEIQLNTRAGFEGKTFGLGHKMYELNRELAAIAIGKGLPEDVRLEAAAFREEVKRLSKRYYEGIYSDRAIENASSREIIEAWDSILQKVSGSVISTNLSPSIRKSLDESLSNINARSSFSQNSTSRDMGTPPSDKKIPHTDQTSKKTARGDSTTKSDDRWQKERDDTPVKEIPKPGKVEPVEAAKKAAELGQSQELDLVRKMIDEGELTEIERNTMAHHDDAVTRAEKYEEGLLAAISCAE
jgi:hypothetical protein